MHISRIEHNIEQNSLDWINLRMGKITSSQMQSVLPNSKGYGSARDTYLNKLVAERVLQGRCDADMWSNPHVNSCLLYTSDAADES